MDYEAKLAEIEIKKAEARAFLREPFPSFNATEWRCWAAAPFWCAAKFWAWLALDSAKSAEKAIKAARWCEGKAS